MDDFDRAVALALEAHYGQTDKTGRPYFEHCQRVALRLGPTADANLRIVAYLHDVPEKAPGWSLLRLKEFGFAPEVLGAVEALSRRDDETDDAFVARACSNPTALAVKRADLEDNLWQAEKIGGDVERVQRELALLADFSQA